MLKLLLFTLVALLSNLSLASFDNTSLYKADSCLNESNYDEAKGFYKNALASLGSREIEKRCELNIKLGYIYKVTEDFDEAFAVFDKALLLEKKIKNIDLSMRVKISYAEFLRSIGECQKSLEVLGSINLSNQLDKSLTSTKAFYYNRLLDKEGQYDLNAELSLQLEKIKVGETKLEDIVDVNEIYWDLGSYAIRADAAVELDKIAAAMNDNPNVHIELGSHTDSRGGDRDNLRLSELRAKAASIYIKDKITNPVRVTFKGYGETQLKNRCKDGVNCSDSEHQENRRTEFKITKF